MANLVSAHGDLDVLAGYLDVANVLHIVARQLQNVRRNVLQHRDQEQRNRTVDLVLQHLLKISNNKTLFFFKITCSAYLLQQGVHTVNRKHRFLLFGFVDNVARLAQGPLVDRGGKGATNPIFDILCK